MTGDSKNQWRVQRYSAYYMYVYGAYYMYVRCYRTRCA